MALSVRFHSPYLPAYSQDPLPYLLQALESATQTIDVWTSGLNADVLVEQAAAARRRGVGVRWLIDGATVASSALLALNGFKRIADWRSYPGTTAGNHQNAILIDGRRLITSSAPFTGAGLYLQDSLNLTLDSVEVGAGYARAFAACWDNVSAANGMWTDLTPAVENVCVGPDQHVSAHFTPFDGPVLLEKACEVIFFAETQIYFALPSLGDPRLVDSLEERARAGVHITGVLDARLTRSTHFERSPALKSLLMNGRIRVMRALARNGQEYRDWMSLRTIVSDSQWLYVGSPEYTLASSPLPAENALVLDSSPVARQCGAFIEALYQLARTGGHKHEENRHIGLYSSEYASRKKDEPIDVTPGLDESRIAG